jgi:hypothetical protein
MRRTHYLAGCLLVVALQSGPAVAAVRVGATITDDGLRSFYLAIENYYRVPERELIVVRERHVPDDELAVVFFLADRARQPAGMIVDMRLDGRSWIDIAWHFNLGSDVFYVPLDRQPGPPYGRAYGYFKKTKQSDWPRLRLSDADVINLVNLRFISDHYRCSPYEVTRLRHVHRSFAHVAWEADRRGHRGHEGDDDRDSRRHGKDRGRGHGSDHGHDRD